jgi:hypothetical protein
VLKRQASDEGRPTAPSANPPEMLRSVVRGYRSATPAERAAFGSLATCSMAIGASRAITFVQEQRRRAPMLRSIARRAYHAPGGQHVRVHHFLPGIGLSTLAGAIAIFGRKDGRESWLSLLFGTGLGLTLDEIALLVKLDNPYWGNQVLVLGQGGAAGLGAFLLALRFQRAGTQLAQGNRNIPGSALGNSTLQLNDKEIVEAQRHSDPE